MAAVVLAAGTSSRLGRPKQLISVDGQTLIRRTVVTVLHSTADVVVVTTSANGVDFEAELHGLQWTRAPVNTAQEGQSHSVRAGLDAVEFLGGFDAVLFLPCDLPLLSSSHLNALMSEYRSGQWLLVASRYAEVLGAPMIVSRELWPEVQQLRGDAGARKLLASHPQTTTFVPWEQGQFDLDTPRDVEEWMRSFAFDAPRTPERA